MRNCEVKDKSRGRAVLLKVANELNAASRLALIRCDCCLTALCVPERAQDRISNTHHHTPASQC
jgi:hypothetical protein